MIKPVYVMVGLVVIFAAGAIYTIWERDKIRPGKAIVVTAESRLASANSELARVRTLPRLPLIDPTWTRARFFFESCGLIVQPLPADSQEGVFPGPASAWHAAISGHPLGVLACANAAASEFPIYFNTVDLSPSSGRVTLSVLGQLEELKL